MKSGEQFNKEGQHSLKAVLNPTKSRGKAKQIVIIL